MKPNTATGDEAFRPFEREELPGILSLAATPVFALMAMLAAVFGGGSGMHGSGMHGLHGLIDGMASMYLLMSVFHAAPWLRLLAIRRAAARFARGLRAVRRPAYAQHPRSALEEDKRLIRVALPTGFEPVLPP